MNEFIKNNKKYLIILLAGLIIFIAPDFLKRQNYTYEKNEEKFIEVMRTAKGVGEIKIMSGKTKEGEISGIVIVAQGAESLDIKKQISDAAVAAFNVQPHKVQIFSYKQEADVK